MPPTIAGTVRAPLHTVLIDTVSLHHINHQTMADQLLETVRTTLEGPIVRLM